MELETEQNDAVMACLIEKDQVPVIGLFLVIDDIDIEIGGPCFLEASGAGRIPFLHQPFFRVGDEPLVAGCELPVRPHSAISFKNALVATQRLTSFDVLDVWVYRTPRLACL